jgi:hypothetical protein
MESAVLSEPPIPRTYENHAGWDLFSDQTDSEAFHCLARGIETPKGKGHQCGVFHVRLRRSSIECGRSGPYSSPESFKNTVRERLDKTVR